MEKTFVSNMAFQRKIKRCKNLEELLGVLRKYDNPDYDTTSLPVYGGDEPDSTVGVWSWDTDNILIGDSSDDYEIVPRNYFD